MKMSRWRVCELWMAICVAYATAAAVAGAPSVGAATALVALSCVPVASLMLWWPSDAPLATPATWTASR